MAKKKFKKHPSAIALDEWIESEEGQTCSEGTTYGDYLRNRLYRAFMAGWNARDSRKGRSDG